MAATTENAKTQEQTENTETPETPETPDNELAAALISVDKLAENIIDMQRIIVTDALDRWALRGDRDTQTESEIQELKDELFRQYRLYELDVRHLAIEKKIALLQRRDVEVSAERDVLRSSLPKDTEDSVAAHIPLIGRLFSLA